MTSNASLWRLDPYFGATISPLPSYKNLAGAINEPLRFPEADDAEFAEKSQRFRYLLSKSVSQFLNTAERSKFSKLLQQILSIGAWGKMDVVVATSQAAAKQVDSNLFVAIVSDEATITREKELLSVWRHLNQVVVLIGDPEQLRTTILSSKEQNPFASYIALSPLD
ncbi:MAG: hypothetical protein Q9167_003557 [Letrouitia subvulpina]